MKIYCFAVAALTLFIDQATKFIAKSAGLRLHFNTGVSFGLLSDFGYLPTVVSSFLVLIVFAAVFTENRRMDTVVRLLLSLVLGGSLSNLADRILFGSVVDWIPMPFSSLLFDGGLMFNAADIAIGAGALCAAALLVFGRCESERA
ncbi:MAG: signal peptidase II [Synergistaceae bacterium]